MAVHRSIPLLHVADVRRSAAFYGLLGLEVADVHEPDGELLWCLLRSGGAELMLARADAPVDPAAQAALLYVYADDLDAVRDRLERGGARPGPVHDGRPGPRRELRVDDPDGWCVMVAEQAAPRAA